MRMDIKKLEVLDLTILRNIKKEEISYKPSQEDCSYIAKVDDEAVGYIFGRIKEEEGFNSSRYIKIEDIYVKPKNRNYGIGKKLLESILFEAKDKGINGALINGSCEEVTETIKLYNKLGYRSWYIQMF
ncbi:MAG TPA: GNAT family N-acetyltransferase [Clostridiaceae bacterium]